MFNKAYLPLLLVAAVALAGVFQSYNLAQSSKQDYVGLGSGPVITPVAPVPPGLPAGGGEGIQAIIDYTQPRDLAATHHTSDKYVCENFNYKYTGGGDTGTFTLKNLGFTTLS